ncbi:sensor histidine kinase, partial [Dryocola clanedunensis]
FSDKLTRHLGDEADEKSLHYLGVISNSARRLAALIDDLLVYSRLGRAAMRLQAVDMQSLVADTRAMLDANQQSEAESTGVPHHVDWKIAPLPIIVSDENMMRQVWLNLLGNAIKFTERGQIRLRVQRQGETNAQHQLRFEIADSGIGIDDALQARLFQSFSQADASTTRLYGGTGLGLSIVIHSLGLHHA